MAKTPDVVGIVVDPQFGQRIDDLLDRMPVWIADNRTRTACHGPYVRLSVRATNLSRDGSAGLVVHANDQQFGRMPLVVEAERRDGPTPAAVVVDCSMHQAPRAHLFPYAVKM